MSDYSEGCGDRECSYPEPHRHGFACNPDCVECAAWLDMERQPTIAPQSATDELEAADAAYTAAVQAAVSNHGDWADVQVARSVVHQVRSAQEAGK